MAFQWSDFMEVASALGTEDEARCRSAIGRAYYAAFGEIRAFVETEKQVRLDGEVHARLIDVLTAEESVPRKLLGAHLRNLRGKRNRADYFAEPAVSKEDAVKAIEDAKALLGDLEKLRTR